MKHEHLSPHLMGEFSGKEKWFNGFFWPECNRLGKGSILFNKDYQKLVRERIKVWIRGGGIVKYFCLDEDGYAWYDDFIHEICEEIVRESATHKIPGQELEARDSVQPDVIEGTSG